MKSLVGLILGVLGSIFNVFVSLFFGVMFFLVILVSDIVSSGSSLDKFISSIGIWSILLSIWFLVFAVLGFIYSSMINKDDKVKKGGIGCLIIGFLTVNIFLVIAGFMGLLASKNTSSISSSNPISVQSVPIEKVSETYNK